MDRRGALAIKAKLHRYAWGAAVDVATRTDTAGREQAAHVYEDWAGEWVDGRWTLRVSLEDAVLAVNVLSGHEASRAARETAEWNAEWSRWLHERG